MNQLKQDDMRQHVTIVGWLYIIGHVFFIVIGGGERFTLPIEARPDVFTKLKAEVRNGQLVIQMGGSWSDKISAAFATSLSRLRIRYVVTVKKLTGLDIMGLAHVKVDNIETDQLRVKFGGLGNLNMAGLNAHRLDVVEIAAR